MQSFLIIPLFECDDGVVFSHFCLTTTTKAQRLDSSGSMDETNTYIQGRFHGFAIWLLQINAKSWNELYTLT
ncbi:hypothetical protein SPOG_05517 [Schizosaccharomyces cryophilus OY26]|uniref:Uncharacterized protein n=1 Tax=Schizosaccharomyces cryophilus (strain OY26 / ATCC MYA-4695 / CBS 11777 / NBRC 106824 / NRRL Y48691) TaxID=653667 RepID=S9W5P0_SCHCR|nr:uncharacterized protein SPOG_05517 [Schizosaccharomyces cryophilus OY26]EPY53300.1 hypothetical protein SPOG_05517 [Schizosaccharomyces cryophilus OY26]